MQSGVHLDEPVVRHMRRDVVSLRPAETVAQSLDRLRCGSCGDVVMYFYVVDDDGRLLGVVPARKLLVSPPETTIESVMIKSVVAIPDSFTVLEACELFAFHRYLAFPVVDSDRKLLGVIDVSLFTEEMFDIQEREQTDSLFETLGFRVSQARTASLWPIVRMRFPWLLATIASGTLCALLVGQFEWTLTQSLVLAFFLTLVLGLGESVSVQTMTVAIYALRHETPDRTWYRRTLLDELGRSQLMGLSCSLIVGAIAWLWKGDARAALVIAGGIQGALFMACLLGVSVPTLFHRLKIDLKIASGPVTLALTDLCTIVCYFSLAAWAFGR